MLRAPVSFSVGSERYGDVKSRVTARLLQRLRARAAEESRVHVSVRGLEGGCKLLRCSGASGSGPPEQADNAHQRCDETVEPQPPQQMMEGRHPGQAHD